MREAIKLFQQGKIDEAEAIARRHLAVDPHDPDALHIAGAVAGLRQRCDEAIDLLSRAVQRRPNDAQILCNLGTVRRSLGEFVQARQLYTQALAAKPEFAQAYFYLSQIGRFEDDELLQDILSLLRQSPLSEEDRSFLHFAAGKICDDLRRWDLAFYHYQLGNAAGSQTHDPYEFMRQVDQIMEVFTADRLRTLGELGHASQRPIFIVGMPRSGTTLVEQILASHPDVFAAGELPDIPSIAGTLTQYDPERHPYPRSVLTVTSKAFAGFADAYLQRLGTIDKSEHVRVVDKNPGNFLHVGLIHLMFPHATIVHCRRDAVSTCVSCYFQRFHAGHQYARHLTHLGMYYRQYARLMEYWHTSLPEMVFDLQYEQLVQDLEPTARSLLRRCRLEWDDRCLSPHKTARAVATASAWQVRQQVNSDALNRYAGYEPFLGPLRNALNPDDS